ncbi:MAG: sulfotransferase [Actinomycetota bacterium]|nr:sulfotransferase [Actinomycetota bacterium]
MTMMQGPVFIAGLERSGTSLIYALLASHPKIAMTRRTNLWTHFYKQYGDLSDPVNFEHCLGTMMRYKRLIKLKPDAERLRHEFRAGEPSYARLFSLIEEHHAERLGKPRWGDKSLNTERYADAILAAYPDACILHMIRDPRDRYASSLTRWEVRRGGVGAGTAEWLSSSRLGIANEAKYPQNYKVIIYESLARSPEDSIRQICEFIGEPYAPEMLSMRGAPVFRDKGSNSSYGQRDPGVISTDSIGRFREILTANQISFIQRRAGPEMKTFGYQPEVLRLLFAQRLRFAIGDLPVESARLSAWRIREAFRDRAGRPVPSYRLVERIPAT